MRYKDTFKNIGSTLLIIIALGAWFLPVALCWIQGGCN